MGTTVRRRWWYYGAVGILGLVFLGAGQPPSSPSPPGQPPAPQATALAAPTAGAPAPAQQASPMDGPLRLIQEAQQAYQNVRDYTCLLIKRERINGKLPPD